MTKFEWLTRCQMQFSRITKDFTYDWGLNAELCYDHMLENHDDVDDPEYYANEEIDCWTE